MASKAFGLAQLGNAYNDGALSNRNILINGDMRVNQRGVTIAAAAVGQYGPDRWKRTAGGMTQIVEDVNYIPNTVYTLSGTNVTTQQLTSPASGHWTLPDLPITATNVQLELGDTATPFEHRSYGQELALCQRYYQRIGGISYTGISGGINFASGQIVRGCTLTFISEMRSPPTVGIVGTLIATDRITNDTLITGIANWTPSVASATVMFSKGAVTFSDYQYVQIASAYGGGHNYLALDAEL